MDDEVAGLVGKRHTHMNVITASVDNLRFLRGAYQRDVVVIIGKVTYVGNTSMEVKVDTYKESLEGERTPINHAYFTMVALDENDKPTQVPRLELETDEEREEWERAKKKTRNPYDEKRRRLLDIKKARRINCTPCLFFEMLGSAGLPGGIRTLPRRRPFFM